MPGAWRLPVALLVFAVLSAAAAGIGARNPTVWALESLASLAFVAVVAFAGRGGRLSTISYALCAAFLALHAVGSHFTYGRVPGPWEWDGRNHYDRLVHFMAGFLLTPVVAQAVRRSVWLPARWRRAVALSFVVAGAGLFEVAEMGLAFVGQASGADYQGMQGDPFDPVWDIFMAFVGALLVMGTRHMVDAARRAQAAS